MQGKYDDPSKTEGKTGRKNVLLDVLKLIGSCAIPSAKAMYAIWSKIAGVVKDEAEETNPRLSATLLDNKNAPTAEYYGPESVNLRIDSITVSGKTVIVESYGWWAATDCFACATMQVTDTFTWNGNGFTRGPRSALHLAT